MGSRFGSRSSTTFVDEEKLAAGGCLGGENCTATPSPVSSATPAESANFRDNFRSWDHWNQYFGFLARRGDEKPSTQGSPQGDVPTTVRGGAEEVRIRGDNSSAAAFATSTKAFPQKKPSQQPSSGFCGTSNLVTQEAEVLLQKKSSAVVESVVDGENKTVVIKGDYELQWQREFIAAEAAFHEAEALAAEAAAAEAAAEEAAALLVAAEAVAAVDGCLGAEISGSSFPAGLEKSRSQRSAGESSATSGTSRSSGTSASSGTSDESSDSSESTADEEWTYRLTRCAEDQTLNRFTCCPQAQLQKQAL